MSRTDPRAEYERRRRDRQRTADEARRRERILSNVRLAAFVAGLVVAVVAWRVEAVALAWVLLPMAGFGVVVARHVGVRRQAERAARSVAFYERGLARLDGRWIGSGRTGERYLTEDHLNAEDLDLFGTGSLFELLATVRTRMGEDVLADWLSSPAAIDEITARQEAIDELRDRVDLREEIALAGEEVEQALDPAVLSAWGEGEVWRPPVPVRRGLLALSIVTSVFLVAFGLAYDTSFIVLLGPGVYAVYAPVAALGFLGLALVEGAVAACFKKRVRVVIDAVGAAEKDLSLLGSLLERIEAEAFASERLVRLATDLETDGLPPSTRIAALRRRVEWLDSGRNQMFAPVRPLLLLGTQLAISIEVWRARCGASLPGWLRAVGEFEALCALAGHAFEHPADPFPEIVGDGPRLEATAIAHPLLPEDRAVANDLSLGGDLRLLIVSGSNMSGKSTLMRTLGTNAVLAFAGAPVRARRLVLSPFAIGASIRISDSLLAGNSRFYAELKRLRAVVAAASRPPGLLFLLDEIFAGTNSHDRRIGAEAILRTLVEKGAIGLVTTHDLALARVADDDLADRARNVHFVDHLEDGKMVFDFRLRDGVVQKSNALELMRAVGLEV